MKFIKVFGVFKMKILLLIFLLFQTAFVFGLVNFQYEPIVITKTELDAVQSISENEWLDFVHRGIESDNQEKSLELNLYNANVTVQNGTISHAQLLDTLPNDEALRDSEVADKILKSSVYIYNSKCAPQGVSGERCEAILGGQDLPRKSELYSECQKVLQSRRDAHYPFRRLLPRHYIDGFYRMYSENLPKPLSISKELCENRKEQHVGNGEGPQLSLAIVQWAQFISSDLSKTVVTSMSNGMPIECCSNQNYRLQPRHYHPACAPLIRENTNNRYGLATCLNYVRSALAVGNTCSFAAPEQLNQATADLDMSPLYGFTESSRRRIRLYKNGLLKSTNAEQARNSLLPMVTKEAHHFCAHRLDKEGSNRTSCFMAGDSRVNSNPFTITLYTLFMRNHNQLAMDLKKAHPQWDDEKLYQHAKLINTDIYQRIVFKEWLVTVLGKGMVNEIDKEQRKRTKDKLEPKHQVSNEFAIAASRFYLSMMPNVLHNYALKDTYTPNSDPPTDIFTLKEQLYNTNISYTSNKIDAILNAILHQRTMNMDNSYVESLVPDSARRPTHSDALAFDIQRGRDHGLQPYYKYLEICTNVKISKWDDLKQFIANEDIEKLKKVYQNWQDIDLIVGGISEIPAKDAAVGPTFQCIIAEQFAQIPRLDSNKIDVYNDNEINLNQYKDISGHDLICRNSNLKYVSSNIFEISNENPPISC
ncbi:immune-regulated catalase [Musca autumnalis]|uniref:immune-regulated catalase n=1 Tax=Musca autumnalis TaxID=221902 RepID=UPI003CF31E51